MKSKIILAIFVTVALLLFADHPTANTITIQKKLSIQVSQSYSFEEEYYGRGKSIIYCDSGEFVCIDVNSYKKVWSFKSLGKLIKVIGDKILLKAGEGANRSVICIDFNTARVIWKIPNIIGYEVTNDSVYLTKLVGKQYYLYRHDLNGIMKSKYNHLNATDMYIGEINDKTLSLLVDSPAEGDIYVFLDKYTLHYINKVRQGQMISGPSGCSSRVDGKYFIQLLENNRNIQLKLFDNKEKVLYWTLNFNKQYCTGYFKIIKDYLFLETYLIETKFSRLYCINIKTGKVLWQFNSTKDYQLTPHFVNNLVFLEEYQKYPFILRCTTIDITTGKQKAKLVFESTHHINAYTFDDRYLFVQLEDSSENFLNVYNLNDLKLYNKVKSPQMNKIVSVYKKHLLAQNYYCHHSLLEFVGNGQYSFFENCSKYICAHGNKFFFYNDAEKAINLFVTTGDL